MVAKDHKFQDLDDADRAIINQHHLFDLAVGIHDNGVIPPVYGDELLVSPDEPWTATVGRYSRIGVPRMGSAQVVVDVPGIDDQVATARAVQGSLGDPEIGADGPLDSYEPYCAVFHRPDWPRYLGNGYAASLIKGSVI